jgi:hypothetical protein
MAYTFIDTRSAKLWTVLIDMATYFRTLQFQIASGLANPRSGHIVISKISIKL